MKANNLLKKIGAFTLSFMMVVTMFQQEINIVRAEEVTPGAIGAVTSKPTQSGTDVKNVVDLKVENGKLRVTFLQDNIFRLNFEREANDFLENAKPALASQQQYDKVFILEKHTSDYPGVEPTVNETSTTIELKTNAIILTINKSDSLMKLTDIDGNVKWEEAAPISITGEGKSAKATQTLKTSDDEYFFGGGTQNGYFSHKNTKLQIRTGGGWEDGGRSNPVPFYMSTKGYGVLRHTFAAGDYDFSKTATFTHEEDRFDAFYYVEAPTDLKALIDDFTEMTGRPVFWPRWGQYIGHADCYNYNANTGERDLNTHGTTVLENYVVNHEIPLGWMLPQDGYGCHYGKTGTVDGNIENLKKFVDRANELGVEVGMWTQSNLYDESAAVLRNVDKEVLTAGTRGIKTDVAWVGEGYAMQMNSVKTGYDAIAKSGDRPFIFSLYGWAGSQRYAGMWSGDQAGGRWEYIRFQIPTYIGSGLTGQPNIGSDIDSIYKGNRVIATRDLQWKAFSPMLYNMGGWDGSKADDLDGKTPWEYTAQDGGESEAIQRFYLKTRSELTPYNYTLAKEANTNGTPLVRAMVLEFPNDPYTYTKATQYQYMWGENLLVAPVYEGPSNNTDAGKRDGIYLPDESQTWIDYLSGEQYQGGQTLYNFEAPLWKLPIFVKSGAIIPMTEDNNASGEITDAFDRIFDIYPDGDTDYDLYEDDGVSIDGGSATTHITSSAPKMVDGEANDGAATITIDKRKVSGNYASEKKATELKINTRKEPTNVKLTFNGEDQELVKVTKAEYEAAVANNDDSRNIYYYDTEVNLNKYSQGDKINNGKIITGNKLFVRTVKTNVNDTKMVVTVEGFNNSNKAELVGEAPAVPTLKEVGDNDTTPTAITLNWDEVEKATSYDVLVDGKYILSNVTNPFTYKNLPNKTAYTFKVRASNEGGKSAWSNEITASTKDNPFKQVPESMSASWDGGNESYSGKIGDICDRDLSSEWHSSPGGAALGKKVTIDMKYVYDIESVMYVPRQDFGNGTLQNIDIEISKDNKVWKMIKDDYTVNANQYQKLIDMQGDLISFDNSEYARYIRITVNKSVGGFFDAKEVMPIFKDGSVPTTAGASNVRLHTDELSDQDLVPLRNYNGFEYPDVNYTEQVSRADMNYDGVIDGYDLAYVGSKLDGGIIPSKDDTLTGTTTLMNAKGHVNAGEEITMYVTGNALTDVNAFSMKLPFDKAKFELVNVLPTVVSRNMMNYSVVRTHDDQSSDLYIAFANRGNAERINGNKNLAKITVKALVDTDYEFTAENASIVNSNFSSKDSLTEDVLDDDWFPSVGTGQVNVPNSEISASTTDESKFQSGFGIYNTIDGGTAYPECTDTVWNYGSKAPYDITYTFKTPKTFDYMTVYDRTDNFGVGIKEFSVSAVLEDDSVVQIGTFQKGKTADEPSKKVDFDKVSQPVKSVTIVFTDAHNKDADGNANMSIGEVEFTSNTKINVEEIDFTEESYTMYSSNIINVKALVKPSDATNSNYKIESEDESIVQIRKISDGKGGYIYQAIAVAPGKTNLIATSVDDETKSKKVEITVKSGVDTSVLEDEITKVNKLIKDIYTEESWNKVVSALEDAKTILKNDKATDAMIEDATIKLADAINALEEIPVDPSTLIVNDKISADALYSESNTADKMFDDDLATYWESPYGGDKVGLPKDVILTLDGTFKLEKLSFTSHTAQNGGVTEYEVYTSMDGKNWTIANAGSVNPSDYKAGNNVQVDVRFAPVNAKYVKLTVLGGVGRIAEEDNLYARIAEMQLFGTEIPPVDKSDLKEVIDTINALDKSIFTQDELDIIQGIVDEALLVYNDVNATQSEVDQAVINAASGILELLSGKLDDLENMENPGYTPESWNKFQDAISNLKDVLEDPNASDQDIENALNDLWDSISALELKDTPTEEVPGTNGDGNNTGSSTGDTTNRNALMLMLLLAGGAIVLIGKKKKLEK